MTRDELNKRPKAYLATKVSGVPLSKVKAVIRRMEVRAMKEGFDTVNPLIVGDQKLSWEDNMKRCIKKLVDCDVVYASQWRNSPGAQMEIDIARKLGIRVVEC